MVGFSDLPGGHSILVVEDSPTVRSIVSSTLQMAPIGIDHIHHAANGVEALQILEDAPVDLIVSDLEMPEMNGAELIDRIRRDRRFKDIPIVVVSHRQEDVIQAFLQNKGIQAIVPKPFKPGMILQAIQEALRPKNAQVGVKA